MPNVLFLRGLKNSTFFALGSSSFSKRENNRYRTIMSISELETESPRPQSSQSQLSTTNQEILQIFTKLRAHISTSENPEEVQEQLKLFVQEWKHETEKEKNDLEILREKVKKRKVTRSAQEQKLAELRAQDESLRAQLAEEERMRKNEDKLKRIEEAEKRRQKMIEEEKSQGKRNFAVTKRPATEQIQTNRELTQEEREIMKNAALSVRIKPLGIDGLSKERLKRRAAEIWNMFVALTTEVYDLEEVQKRQEYDYKELKERQKQQLRQKAMKLGLPEEALMGRYPPKIMTASKYERRPGLKPFGETKELFEGGFVKFNKEFKDRVWKERQELFITGGGGELPPWVVEARGGRTLPKGEEEVEGEEVEEKGKVETETENNAEEEIEEEEIEEEEGEVETKESEQNSEEESEEEEEETSEEEESE